MDTCLTPRRFAANGRVSLQKKERSGLQSACDELIDKGAINKANSGLYTSGAVLSWASSSSDRGLVDPQSPPLAQSMILPDARSLPQLPEKLGRSGVAASR